MTESEYRLAAIVWANEPLTSMELVKICERELRWKKSTTYTVLKKLCDNGVLRNKNTVVSSAIDKANLQRQESEHFLERTFSGSLPSFLTAFISGKKLSAEEADALISLINEHKEE